MTEIEQLKARIAELEQTLQEANQIIRDTRMPPSKGEILRRAHWAARYKAYQEREARNHLGLR